VDGVGTVTVTVPTEETEEEERGGIVFDVMVDVAVVDAKTWSECAFTGEHAKAASTHAWTVSSNMDVGSTQISPTYRVVVVSSKHRH
jgi:hypothetical protein